MPTAKNGDIVASSVTDENAACLQDLLACSSTYSETEGSKVTRKAIITMATLSKELSGNSKDIANVQVDITKKSKGDTAISSYPPYRSKTNIIAKNESATVKKPPIYVIDSSSGNSFSADNKKDLSDSIDIVEPQIAKITCEDNLSKSAKSKGNLKNTQKTSEKLQRLPSSINTGSKAKRTIKGSKQIRQNSVEYENMQVVGYRMLESGAYECVLIGKDKRRCSVIFEQCNVEITKQSF